MRLPTDTNWERLFDVLGAREFFNLVTSPVIQDRLLVVKIAFMFFAAFFFVALIYFYMNSSYLRYLFLQDLTEFFSWQAYGLREVNKRWKGIAKRVARGSERDYKMALAEADDFLYEELQDGEFQGSNFEEMVESAGKRIMPNWQDILQAHKVRNMIVHDVNYKLDINAAKKMLDDYEKAVKYIYSY